MIPHVKKKLTRLSFLKISLSTNILLLGFVLTTSNCRSTLSSFFFFIQYIHCAIPANTQGAIIKKHITVSNIPLVAFVSSFSIDDDDDDDVSSESGGRVVVVLSLLFRNKFDWDGSSTISGVFNPRRLPRLIFFLRCMVLLMYCNTSSDPPSEERDDVCTEFDDDCSIILFSLSNIPSMQFYLPDRVLMRRPSGVPSTLSSAAAQ